jgi:glutathione synthase
MERIYPVIQNSVLCRNGEATLAETVHEFGVFGVYLGKRDKCSINQYAGYLMRTKFADKDEGGITTGNGVFNSPAIF